MPLPNSWQFQAIGTDWNIQTDSLLSRDDKTQIRALIEVFNYNYSRFQPDSIVRTMYDVPGSYVFSDHHFPDLYALYEQLYKLTNGSVTPHVGKVLVDAGYDENYNLTSFSETLRVAKFGEVVWDGKSTLTTKQPVLLDFGAAAKGLLVDQIAELLQKMKHSEWFIDASGDSAHHASLPYVLGLEHPFDTSKIIGTVELSKESLCASAINRRAWKNGHHVIDGKTGKPTEDIVATWVIADSTMLADGLATGLFFTWEELVVTYPTVAYLRMDCSGTIEMNQTMKERITLLG